MPGSLKADTHSKIDKGVMRRVDPSSAIPGNWQACLHIDGNKTELISFLAMNAAGININKQAITTDHTDVLCTNHQDVLGLAPCTQEEADTHILLHLEDAGGKGTTKCQYAQLTWMLSF